MIKYGDNGCAIYDLSLNLRINYLPKMKKESINLRWINGMSFEAKVDEYKITIDSDKEFEGFKWKWI